MTGQSLSGLEKPSAFSIEWRCTLRSSRSRSRVFESPINAPPALIGSNVVKVEMANAARLSVSPNDRIRVPRSRKMAIASSHRFERLLYMRAPAPTNPSSSISVGRTGRLSNCNIRRLTSVRSSKKDRTGRATNSTATHPMQAPITPNSAAPIVSITDPSRSGLIAGPGILNRAARAWTWRRGVA